MLPPRTSFPPDLLQRQKLDLDILMTLQKIRILAPYQTNLVLYQPFDAISSFYLI
jgi:hypothetical protein